MSGIRKTTAPRPFQGPHRASSPLKETTSVWLAWLAQPLPVGDTDSITSLLSAAFARAV